MDNALIGLAGVVLGATLTVARELWIDNRARKKRAEYLAIRVTCALDRYVEGCVAVVGDDGLYHGQLNPDGCSEVQVSTPILEYLTFDVDWKSLPSDLMYEILNFPNQADEANHKINSVFEHLAHPPDYDEGFEERQYQYATLGINAVILADKLRKAFCLPSRNYDSWNPVEYMEKTKEDILHIRMEKQRQFTALSETKETN